MPRLVGRVRALYRYPVKSMAGSTLLEVAMDRYGIVGDRRLALRRVGDSSGFPWLTATRVPTLVNHRATAQDPDRPSIVSTTVTSPDGRVWGLGEETFREYISDLARCEIQPMALQQGAFDWSGISIISVQALQAMSALVGRALDARRFRPNILVDSIGADDLGWYPEDAWIGRTLSIGLQADGPRVAVTDLDERCAMINLDPDGGSPTPEILRTVVQHRRNLAGVYGVPILPGVVRVGDPIYES